MCLVKKQQSLLVEQDIWKFYKLICASGLADQILDSKQSYLQQDNTLRFAMKW